MRPERTEANARKGTDKQAAAKTIKSQKNKLERKAIGGRLKDGASSSQSRAGLSKKSI